MASIYESPGQQVALTGPQTSPSFQPGTAYDPSRMMLQQSERDLGAFAQFSDTLTKFITDKAKEKNEQEVLLGIADIVNGDMTPSADALATYKQNVGILQAGAEEDTKIGNELATTDLATGEQFKANSKAISGHRAYGQAIGHTQNAAGSALGFMTQWRSSTDKVLRTRDGRLISPSEAQEPDDIQAMLAMGQQEFIRTQQLAGINPMIIAKHLTPTMRNVRSQLFANTLTKAIANKQETAISEIKGEAAIVGANTSATTESLAADFQRLSSSLLQRGGMSRGKSTDTVVQNVLDSLDNLPESEALAQLEKFGEVEKSDTNQSIGKLKDLYPDLFKAAKANIYKDADAASARDDKKQNEEAQEAHNNYLDAKTSGISNENLAVVRQNTITVLEAAAREGSDTASKLLREIKAEPANLDNALYQGFIGRINNGLPISQEDVDKAFQGRQITDVQKNTLYQYAEKNIKDPFLQQLDKPIKEIALAYLKNTVTDELVLNSDDNPLLFPSEMLKIRARLGELAWDWSKDFKVQNGREPKLQETADFITSQVPKVTDTYLTITQAGGIEVKPTGLITDPKWLSMAHRGKAIPDVVRLTPDVIRLGGMTSGESRQLNEAETKQGLLDVAAGKLPSTRIQDLGRNVPGGAVALLRHQAKINGIPTDTFDSSPKVQELEENFRTSPWATARLNNSNNVYTQRSFQIIQQQQARMRRQQTALLRSPTGSGSFEKPSSVVYENRAGQPGVDLFFESKRFPAVLGGVVKDVRSEPGYGNYVVVESIDPLTGQKVDVLYGHLAEGGSLRPGQRVSAGQVIGTQGGTGNVDSQDGTIASIDFFAPRPSGSRDMTPYSGFDRLRRHVVNQLQNPRSQPTSSGGATPPGAQGYMKRLAYLETRIRDIPNSQGSEGRGYFQAFNAFDQEATAAAGGISPRDSNYENAAFASWKWIEKFNKPAAKAILAGRYDEADRLLRNTWPSLPSGNQQQNESAYREANRYLN
jgi:murein DD-endopeptidase MepM/ murein hydrolase activator NlpD